MVTKVKIRLQCPECGHRFFAVSMFPDCCPGCGYVYDLPDDNVISMPAIRTAVATSVDQVYRDMERSSEVRAEQAAQMAGVPVADMSGLKLTNLKDNTRYGEIAAVQPVNDVTRQMDMISANGGQVGFTSGVAAAQAAHTGADHHAGAKALASMQRTIFNLP